MTVEVGGHKLFILKAATHTHTGLALRPPKSEHSGVLKVKHSNLTVGSLTINTL